MNHKSSVIRKYDFERYEVMLPFLCASGRRKRNYLFGELEKMHPCFSDEFCFDSDFRCVTKKGIRSDVFVINKRKLAEYEEKRRLQGAGFLLENQNAKKRFFVSGKMKSMLAGCAVCVVAAVTGIVFAAVGTKKAEVAEVVEETPVIASEENIVNPPGELAESFFRVVKAAGGNVQSLTWEYDGFKESLSASVQNVYPEQLEDLSVWKVNGGNQQVSYSKGIPEMSVNYSRKTGAGGELKRGSAGVASDFSEFYQEMRTVLKNHGAELVSEKLHPYSIEFLILQKAGIKGGYLFEKIAEKGMVAGIGVSKISIQLKGDGVVSVAMSFEEAFSIGLDLVLLKDFEEVFKARVPQTFQSAYSTSQTFSQSQNKTALKKLGEIREKDGSFTVFYKNEQGKMIRKTEVRN